MPEAPFVTFLAGYGFYEVILPFILVFAIVYGLLSKTHPLGKDKKNVEIMVSLVLALVAIGSLQFSSFLKDFIPQLGFGIVIILGLSLLLGFFGVPLDNKIFLTIGSIIFVIILILQFSNEKLNQAVFGFITNGFTIAIAVIIFIMWLVTRTGKKKEEKGEPTGKTPATLEELRRIKKGTPEMEAFKKGQLPLEERKDNEETP